MRALSSLFLAVSLFISSALFAPSALAADIKIAVADFSRALNEIEDGIQAQERLNTMMAGKQAEIEQKEIAIVALQEEYQAKAAVLSDTARQEYEQQLYNAQMEYQQMAMLFDQQMQQAYMQVMDQLLTKLRDVASEIGEQQGYTLIVESSQGSVIYSVSSIDITDQVIQKYNATHSSSN